MDIASIIKAVLAPGEEQTGRRIADLQPGDKLIGRVLRIESDGRVLMALGGSRALAKIGPAVNVGQTLPLRVVDNGAVLHLRVVPDSTAGKTEAPLPNADFHRVMGSSIKERWTGMMQRLIHPATGRLLQSDLPASVKNALNRIMTLFEPLPVEAGAQKLSQWIKRAVEDRGVLFEKKLSEAAAWTGAAMDRGRRQETVLSNARNLIKLDIKPQLMLLREFLPSSGEPTPLTAKIDAESAGFLRRTVDLLLGHIASQQDRAIARWADGENQQIFVHTLPLPEPNRPVKLKIYYPEKKRKSGAKRMHRIALLLDMDRLGPVRVDLAMQETMLQITFYVPHQKAKDLVASGVETVAASLTGRFEHVSIDLFISAKKIGAFETEDAQGGGAGKIDLSV